MKINQNLLDTLVNKRISIDLSKFQQYQSQNELNINEIKKESQKDSQNFKIRPLTAQTSNTNNPKSTLSTTQTSFQVKKQKTKENNQSQFEKIKENQSVYIKNKEEENDSQEFNDKVEINEEIFLDEQDLTEDILCQINNIQKSELRNQYKIQVRLDLTLNSLYDLKFWVPNLKELKINDSIMNSIRDIGTGLQQLEVLWVSRCGLKDLGGINSQFQNLKELYASYNKIQGLMDICWHENLQIMDLEGNEISSKEEIENLKLVRNLKQVNLVDNKIQDYYQIVKESCSNLQILDDLDIQEYSEKMKQKKYEMQQINNQSVIQFEEINKQNEIQNHKMIQKLNRFKNVLQLDQVNIEELQDQANQIFNEEVQKELEDDEILIFAIKNRKKKEGLKEQLQKSQMHKTQGMGDTQRSGFYNPNRTSQDFKKSNRPQTAIQPRNNQQTQSILGQIFSHEKERQKMKNENGASDLLFNNDKTFHGNPMKAMKFKRKNQFNEKRTINEQKYLVPKNIMDLVQEFRIDVSDDDEEMEEYIKDNYVNIIQSEFNLQFGEYQSIINCDLDQEQQQLLQESQSTLAFKDLHSIQQSDQQDDKQSQISDKQSQISDKLKTIGGFRKILPKRENTLNDISKEVQENEQESPSKQNPIGSKVNLRDKIKVKFNKKVDLSHFKIGQKQKQGQDMKTDQQEQQEIQNSESIPIEDHQKSITNKFSRTYQYSKNPIDSNKDKSRLIDNITAMRTKSKEKKRIQNTNMNQQINSQQTGQQTGQQANKIILQNKYTGIGRTLKKEEDSKGSSLSFKGNLVLNYKKIQK